MHFFTKFLLNSSFLLLNQVLLYSSEYSAIGGVHLELIKLAADLVIYRPDGQQFATYVELAQQKEQAQQRAEQAEAQLQDIFARLQERGINLEDL